MKKLTHFSGKGEVNMVDVSGKRTTKRGAVARGKILMTKDLLKIISKEGIAKGDLFSTAKIAGIMAAKSTAGLIPLCHLINLENVKIEIVPEGDTSLSVTAEVISSGKTGVEMEALTAVAISCLTVYDMCKSYSKEMIITDIHLVEKWGGRSGHFRNKKG